MLIHVAKLMVMTLALFSIKALEKKSNYRLIREHTPPNVRHPHRLRSPH